MLSNPFQNADSVLPPIQPLLLPATRGIHLSVLRTDLIHPQISGNKWYKLKYNLLAAREQGFSRVISFGGAFSNHIHALAWAGRSMGIETVGVIRGEPEYAGNPTLQDCQRWGMKLHFVDRKTYRQRNDVDFLQQLPEMTGPGFVVPEGGSNALAVKGVAELASALCRRGAVPDYLMLAAGTGGTTAGFAAGLDEGIQVLAVPVLKQGERLKSEIAELLSAAGVADRHNWMLDLNGHFGGYGRVSPQVMDCLERFGSHWKLPLDPIYTAKLMLRLEQLLADDYFPPDSDVMVVHTGGLQGTRGLLV